MVVYFDWDDVAMKTCEFKVTFYIPGANPKCWPFMWYNDPELSRDYKDNWSVLHRIDAQLGRVLEKLGCVAEDDNTPVDILIEMSEVIGRVKKKREIEVKVMPGKKREDRSVVKKAD